MLEIYFFNHDGLSNVSKLFFIKATTSNHTKMVFATMQCLGLTLLFTLMDLVALVRCRACDGPQAAAEGHCGYLVISMREGNFEVFQATQILLAHAHGLLVLGLFKVRLVP